MMTLHTQVASTFEVPNVFGVYLIAGGGGAGGKPSAFDAGGGGAGGLLLDNFAVFPGTTWPVVVGAKGLHAPGGGASTNGGDSSVFGLTAFGGGRGGDGGGSAGANGGSGGGGGAAGGGGAGGTGVAGQGYAGQHGTAGGAGGGGGAGGLDGSSVNSSITGTSLHYGRGGGGPGPQRASSGDGGDQLTNGSDGVVIIRYPGPARATGGTITNDNGYTVHTFTSSGTFAVGA